MGPEPIVINGVVGALVNGRKYMGNWSYFTPTTGVINGVYKWVTGVITAIRLPVVPGQAGGGSFQKEKNYIAKKEFAYRMCARRPTSAMPKSFLCLCSPSAVPWW